MKDQASTRPQRNRFYSSVQGASNPATSATEATPNMVRHKTRPVRSLSPDETCSIPTKQEDAHLEAEAEVRGGGGKASPSLSFWAVDWAAGSDEAAPPQQQPQGKTSKSNGIDRAALTSSKDGSAQSSLAAFAPSSSPSSSLAASMPLSMIMSMSKQGSKSSLLLDESDDESEEEAYSHPLSSVQGMPAFSDLQVTIAKAIVKQSGRRDGAANVEDILDYVTKKWKNLRRKDGSQYSSASTYIRRAVQANLRSTANGIALFKMDSRRDGVYWSVCQTVEEAKSPAVSGALGLARPLLPSAVGYHSSDIGLGDDEFWTQMKEEPTSPSASSTSPPPPQAELTKEETQFYEAAKVRMTALQRTVSECIMQSGGSCHFEFILDTVQKKWADIKNEDALPRIANLKKLVGACVARDRGEDSKALFMRDHNAESSGYWKLGLSNPYVKTSGLTLDTKEKGIPSAVPSMQGSGTADQGSSGSGSGRRNVPLTHLQELIIDAIAANGEAADLESIYAYIKERWQGLTRRDGTPYAADIRRAVQSSLFNNSSQSPIFVKLPETDQNTWGLAARGKALLRERQQKMRMAEQDQLIEDDEDDDEDDDDLRTPSFGQANGNGSGGHGLGSPNGNSGGAASDRPKKKRKKKNQFSGIQQMIAEVMERNGGSAPFETILGECQKRWRTLRKRDGAPYNADPKRSINASLTKTPAYGQVFERDPHIEGFWRLTPAAQKVWDQLKTGSVEPAQAAVAPRVMMMPRMNLGALTAASVSPVSAEMHAGSRHDDDDGDGDYLVGNGNGNSRRLEERRELERERRERRRLRESSEGGLGSSPQAGGKDSSSGFLAASTSTSPTDGLAAFAHQAIGDGSFTHFPRGLIREDGSMAMVDEDEMEDDAIDGRRTKKRTRRDEGERDELEGDEDELEYGEGLGEAPKLASMQAMVIRAIRKNGGSSSFKTIYDALCEKVEKDKGLMSAVNWARVHRSNFPGDNNSEEEDDQNAVKVFARNEQGNWSVPDLKLCDWVMKHKRKRIKVDKFVPKKKNSRIDE